jgi:hypothetical protein
MLVRGLLGTPRKPSPPENIISPRNDPARVLDTKTLLPFQKRTTVVAQLPDFSALTGANLNLTATPFPNTFNTISFVRY